MPLRWEGQECCGECHLCDRLNDLGFIGFRNSPLFRNVVRALLGGVADASCQRARAALRTRREQLGLTYQDVANRLEQQFGQDAAVDQAQVNRWLSGMNQMALIHFGRVAKAMELTEIDEPATAAICEVKQERERMQQEIQQAIQDLQRNVEGHDQDKVQRDVRDYQRDLQRISVAGLGRTLHVNHGNVLRWLDESNRVSLHDFCRLLHILRLDLGDMRGFEWLRLDTSEQQEDFRVEALCSGYFEATRYVLTHYTRIQRGITPRTIRALRHWRQLAREGMAQNPSTKGLVVSYGGQNVDRAKLFQEHIRAHHLVVTIIRASPDPGMEDDDPDPLEPGFDL